MVKQRKPRSHLNPGPAPTIAKLTVRVSPFTIGLGAGGVQSYGTVTSSLNDITKTSSYQAVYDEYRITRVRVKFVPCFNDALISTGTTNSSGNFACCIDWDDAVTPSSYADILNHQNVETGNWLRTYSFDYVPKVLVGAETTTVVAAAPISKPWLDTSVATVLHFGLKWTIDPVANAIVLPGGAPIFSVWSEYDLEFRMPT